MDTDVQYMLVEMTGTHAHIYNTYAHKHTIDGGHEKQWFRQLLFDGIWVNAGIFENQILMN